MARWTERRGYTLQLGAATDDEAAPEPVRRQLVRLSLVQRSGLTGRWFNVREARAEAHDLASGVTPSLTGGRTLSWRPLVESEAERLLDQRLRTLQALGYSLLDAEVASPHRGRWDWLYELVRRGLQPSASATGDAATTKASEPSAALRDALERLGMSPEEITEGVATVLSMSPEHLREPDGSTVARVDPDQLGVLLPFLVEHRAPEIRAIGERWLDCPGAAFQLPAATVERWLAEAGRMGDLLAPRLRSEGLALLGPDALARLSKASVRMPVRDDAAHWLRRLD